MSRFGAYLIAMNGDSNKPEVAFAQWYFATQTRKQEILERHLLDDDRVKAHGKFTKSEAELKQVVYESGGNEHGFNTVRGRGHKAYFSRSPEQVAKQMANCRNASPSRKPSDSRASNAPLIDVAVLLQLVVIAAINQGIDCWSVSALRARALRPR